MNGCNVGYHRATRPKEPKSSEVLLAPKALNALMMVEKVILKRISIIGIIICKYFRFLCSSKKIISEKKVEKKALTVTFIVNILIFRLLKGDG